jgi:hypothetical protein
MFPEFWEPFQQINQLRRGPQKFQFAASWPEVPGLDMWLDLKCGQSWGLNPQPVRSNTLSRYTVSELSWIKRHPTGISCTINCLLTCWWGEMSTLFEITTQLLWVYSWRGWVSWVFLPCVCTCVYLKCMHIFIISQHVSPQNPIPCQFCLNPGTVFL